MIHNKKTIIYSVISITVYFIVGLIFYTLHEKFSFLNAFYIITLQITTVGYGNNVPTTFGGKLFTIFYILVGIGFIALALSILSGYFAEKHEKMMIKLLKNDKANLEESNKSYKQILIDLFIIALIFITVVIFYTLYEDFEVIDAIYMACITLTTVGFGDIVPKTDTGKIFAIFWILGGTLFFAKIISDYFNYFINIRQKKIYDNIIKSAIVSYSDLEQFSQNNGTISKYEFLSGVLVKIGSVNKANIKRIMKQFDTIDTDGNGVLDLKDFQENFPDIAKSSSNDRLIEIVELPEGTEHKENDE